MPLTSIPRVNLGIFPTPLQELPLFSQALGGPRIFVKREDLSGLAMGGNKTRQVERMLAKVKEAGADAVVTTASAQSNVCLHLAAGARRLGMKAGFALFVGHHPRAQGNVLLQSILGSEVRLFDESVVRAAASGQTDAEMEKIAADFQAQGLHPCIIPQFRPSPYHPVGATGWVDAAEELVRQLEEQHIRADYLVLAAGSGATMAGLMLGLRMLQHPLQVVGMAVSGDQASTEAKVRRVAEETARLIGTKVSINSEDITIYDYLGEGYGIVSRECVEAIRLLARTEGIFLDPVYTGKAMAGLIDLVRQGRFTARDTVVFLHSGGLPAIFAYPESLSDRL